jgi:hypothetical protein
MSEPVYTFFHEDGPIRLTETELCNEYMRLRAFDPKCRECNGTGQAGSVAHGGSAYECQVCCSRGFLYPGDSA